ncbi:urease accessory protein UreD [Rhizobium sp. CC-YZS058]|uniref:urease accessory protein UreD n=1 Tax=Rhizobium sp. CC-YZS058 TaxID=3042153 RepID=UPI002B05D3AD|nr:urease accessory protein UreD [Rhizobium sp. CC-YZS058]MEA3536664.1 urease accessory protein UreD [Rhizobium sp. CC-YZS058]
MRQGTRTIIDRRHFTWPYCISRTFHRPDDPGGMLSVILQTTSGAIHAEDLLSQRLICQPRGRVTVTTPGATLVHRAKPHQTAEERVIIEAGEDSHLEYLPEPRILFPDSALCQSLDILCRPGASVLVSDAFTCHDPKGFNSPFRLFQSTVICRRDVPIMTDRTWLEGADMADLHPYRAFGNILMLTEESSLLHETIASLNGRTSKLTGLYAAASQLPNSAGVSVRMAGVTVQAVRNGIRASQTAFRLLVRSESAKAEQNQLP